MANDPNQASDNLAEFLKQYANISLVGTQGSPPRKYEIELSLRAYVPDEDGVEIGRDHHVLITLQADHPQSPPLVQALTPLYHPALNEEDDHFAIDEQWAKSPSLPDLVLHLADLITGRQYKMAKPVNPDAVEWYEEHKKELPLDTPIKANPEQEDLLGMLEEDDSDLIVGVEEGPSPAVGMEGDSNLVIGMEEDSSLAVGMEEDIIDDAPDPALYEAQINEIRQLLENGQLYFLDKRLNDLPPKLWFPEREEAEERVRVAKQEIKQLFSQAKQLEDAGEYGRAVECAQAILERLPDHPEAKALLQRLKDSSFISVSLDDALSEHEQQIKKQASKPGQPEMPGAPGEPAVPDNVPPPPKMAWLPADFPLRRVLVGALAAVLLLWVAIMAMNDHAILERVNRDLKNGEALILAKKFAEAQEILERAQGNVHGLTVFWFQGNSLKKRIARQLADPTLVEGIRGYTKYKGKYVSGDVARALEKMAEFEQQAEAQAQSGLYDEAIRTYNNAQIAISGHSLPDEENRLAGLIRKLEVDKWIHQAEQSAGQGKWDEAEDFYRKIDALLQEAGDLAPQFADLVKERRATLQLRQLLDLAAAAIKKNQVEAARSYLGRANGMLSGFTNPSEDIRQMMDAAQLRLQLLDILPNAQRAYQTSQWGEAAKMYQRAIQVVEGASAEVRQNLAGELAQFTRNRDIALANLDYREATSAESRKDSATAVRRGQEALARIAKYGADNEITALRRKIEAGLGKHRQSAGEQSLRRRVESLGNASFRSRYANYRESDLGPPQIALYSQNGSRRIYEYSRTDRSGGRAFKLALYFACDASGSCSPTQP